MGLTGPNLKGTSKNETVLFMSPVVEGGGDRVVVPWYQIVQIWWNLVPKIGVPVPSLYDSVPIKLSSLDDFGIPRTNF